MSVVLALSAKIKTGKSFIGKAFAETVGWDYVNFGDYVRLIAEKRGLPARREVWQEVGEELVRDDLETFCQAVLSQAPRWKPGKSLLVDGVRHIEVSNLLRQIVAPSKYIWVLLTVNEETRIRRILENEVQESRLIEHIESHSTEVQVKDDIPQIADYVIDGNKPLSEIVEELKLISIE